MTELSIYPSVFRNYVSTIANDPIKGHQELFRQAKMLYPDDSISIPSITSDVPVWYKAECTPCLFLAAVLKHPHGDVREIRAGHFSTRFTASEISNFLSFSVTQPENTIVWASGLAQKSDHDSLEAAVNKLAQRIKAFGIPLLLEWENEDRPLLFDTRHGLKKLISDIGLGLMPDKDDVRRRIAFGFNSYHAMMISTAVSHQSRHLHTYVFADNTEELRIQ